MLGNDLPPVVHAELTPEDIGDGCVIVIGDVHGCLSELKALLEKCAADCYLPLLCCPVQLEAGVRFTGTGGLLAASRADTALGTIVCLLFMQHEAYSRAAVTNGPYKCTRLKACCCRCGYEHGRDTVVLVGDLVNKGPEPLQVAPSLVFHRKDP